MIGYSFVGDGRLNIRNIDLEKDRSERRELNEQPSASHRIQNEEKHFRAFFLLKIIENTGKNLLFSIPNMIQAFAFFVLMSLVPTGCAEPTTECVKKPSNRTRK